ncbi:MAG TPA: phosphate signaling complex protein PhoU [Desulfobacteria bacterium]|nr:phosphate signaling complex protein PhoU [Desulfobacteria bacterium]
MASTRHAFDRALEELQQEILRMGSLVETAIYNSVQSLASQDVALAEQVIKGDAVIDQMELDIEDKCLKLIATQQPIAGDLRKISTGFKIITDLERMADNSVDISKVTRRLAGQPLIKPLVDIPRMAALTQQMVKDGLDAYVRSDVALASTLSKKDDEVDHIYAQVFRELLTYMMEDPRTITQAAHLLFVCRYIERIADHATNIGERVVYLVTGERPDLND